MMNKLTEKLIMMILKKGIINQADNIDMEIDIPASALGLKNTNGEIRFRVRAENIRITIEK